VGQALEAVLTNSPKDPESAFSYCSFCGKAAGETKRIATTGAAAICNECLSKAFAILMEGEKAQKGAVKFG
jgi:hypothetical protein